MVSEIHLRNMRQGNCAGGGHPFLAAGVKCIDSALRKISWNAERALELIGV